MTPCDTCAKPHVLAMDDGERLVRCEVYGWMKGYVPLIREDCKGYVGKR